jgi:SAM-dependent methyltransferase
MMLARQSADAANARFWNELCGSSLARSLGIEDDSPQSLRRFDDYYLALYPYLLDHVGTARMAGQTVLEIGLGYGTLGQKIAEAGATYFGLDVALGPVAMMRHRLRLNGFSGDALQGSMLACPIRSESVDQVVSIGCFHHTGDVQRCLDESYRVLRPGGTAAFMLYNRFSYRQWMQWPWPTLKDWAADLRQANRPNAATEEQRRAYDTNAAGTAAPETVFLSVSALRRMLARFSRVQIQKENCTDLALSARIPLLRKRIALPFIPRQRLLPTLGRRLGLDLYVRVWK